MALSDAGKLVAHAYKGGAGNTTKASARATFIPQPSKDYDSRVDTSGRVPSVHYNIPLYQHVPTQVNPQGWHTSPGAIGSAALGAGLGGLQGIPGAWVNAFAQGTANTLAGPRGAEWAHNLNLGGDVNRFIGNAAQGVWNAFGFGDDGSTTKPAVVKDPAAIVLGKGTNTGAGAGGAGGGGPAAPTGTDVVGSVMKGLGSGQQVAQPTYQTAPQVTADQIKPSYIPPYFAYTDPNVFNIPAKAIPGIDLEHLPQVNPSLIDLNSIPQVNVPQMSPEDAAYAQGLLNTGLNLQSPDWNSLMQNAGSIASSEYAPMVQSIIQQGRNAANTIQGYTSGAREAIQGDVRDVAQTYANAAQANTALDQGILNTLSASNPNVTQQAQLESLGVDPTTRAQIAANNNQMYNTTGGVLSSLGELNTRSLNSQSAALQSYIKGLPAQIALGGQQALATVATGASSDLAKIATQEAKDAWGMAKDMGASDQKAGAAYQNAYNTTMSNFYKAGGQKIDVGKANLSASLGAAKTNVGSELTAQGKNQATWLSGAKTNVGATTSILKGNQSAGVRLAGINEQQAVGIEKLNATNEMSAAIHNQGADLSAGKANQNAVVQTNYHNAQLAMQAAKTAVSEENARTARGRLAVSLYKAMNPTASASAAASAGRAARDWFQKAAAFTPMGYKNVPHYNPNTATTSSVRTPTYSKMTYGQMIEEYAQSQGGTPDAQSFAINMANSVVNPGYRGRPLLEQGALDALKQGGIDYTPQFTSDKAKTPYLTGQQGVYLNDHGYANLVQYMHQGVLTHDDGSKERVFTMPPLQGGG